jgi:hypothetical protein
MPNEFLPFQLKSKMHEGAHLVIYVDPWVVRHAIAQVMVGQHSYPIACTVSVLGDLGRHELLRLQPCVRRRFRIEFKIASSSCVTGTIAM